MILYHGNNFKCGLKVIFENYPYYVESVEFVKPGKGQAFSRLKLRNLINKQLIEKTFKSTDTLYSADIVDVTLMYIYNDNKFWYFMHKIHFEQFLVEKSIIQKNYKWLKENNDYIITLWNNKPIKIEMHNFVELEVVSVKPRINENQMYNIKDAQFCQLSTGAIIKVPLFIQQGDIIKIDIRTGKYNSRINK